VRRIHNLLAPRRKNQKVHHRIHSSSPPVPILSKSNSIHTPQPISLRSILIPSFHLHLGLPSGLFPSGFPTKIFYNFLFSSMRAACSTHLIHLDLICLMILGISTNYEAPHFQLPLFSRHIIPLIPIYSSQTLLSNTLSVCSSLNVRYQVSHPYKTNCRIMVLYIFNLYIPGQQAGRQTTLNRMVASIPRSSLILIYPCILIC
jgi:hypothetical protein